MHTEDSTIEKLQHELDSRDVQFGESPRKNLHELPTDVDTSWKDGTVAKTLMSPVSKKKKLGPLVTLFVASVLFFIISVVASVFFFMEGGQVVKSDKVEVQLLGPTTIGAGEEFVMQIAFTNNNPVDMRSADLIVEFPTGTRSATNVSSDQKQIREEIGEVKSGQTVNKTVRAVLFGEEGAEQSIRVAIEYAVESSNAILVKEQEYAVLLSAAPVALSVTAPKEVISGEDAQFTVQVTSNAPTPLKDLILKAEYPFGFTYGDGTPAPRYGSTVWELGDLAPGGKRSVTVRGRLIGQDTDEKFFRFYIGSRSDKNDKELGVTYVVKPVSLVISEPFLSATLSINGSKSNTTVVQTGRTVSGDVEWRNNLPSTILDGEIRVKFVGQALDRPSVATEGGFFNSSDNTLVWSGETDSDLSTIAPGQSGRLGFSFATLGRGALQSLKNPELELEVSVAGRRVGENGVPEQVQSAAKYVLQLATDLLLSSKVTRTTGPITNEGPFPPRAEQETTYTVTWTVSNSSNAADNVVVKATLPAYIRFTNVVAPATEKVTYSPVGGTVTWDLGTVDAQSLQGRSREVSFQIALKPSISQIGQVPILINEQVVKGEDRFTKVEVGVSRPMQTTRLTADPGAQFTDGVVLE